MGRGEARGLFWVKVIYLDLVFHGLVAFCLLMAAPGRTEELFVWTVQPAASARLLGVMYGNAALLGVLGFQQPDWPRSRVLMVLVTPFSLAATIVTFFHLQPFLQHPRFFFVYWLAMYFFLFFTTPLVFVRQEKAHGGRLSRQFPLSWAARAVAAGSAMVLTAIGLTLFIDPVGVSAYWLWTISPLVGRILAVWLISMAAAYAWALWDGDWVRTRPIFGQAFPAGLLLALVPLIHGEAIRQGAQQALVIYLVVTLGWSAANASIAFLFPSIHSPVTDFFPGE